MILALVLATLAPQADPRSLQERLVPSVSETSLTRVVDERAAGRCLGDLVGARNVPLRCTSGADGALGQCEILSSNRTVLRYTRTFQCMASHVRVQYPDGTPAVGQTVRIKLNGRSIFGDQQPE